MEDAFHGCLDGIVVSIDQFWVAVAACSAPRLGTHRADRRLRLEHCPSTAGRCAQTASAAAISAGGLSSPNVPDVVHSEHFRVVTPYCGNYTYDGTQLVTRVDAASDPSRIGSDQVRGVRFEGERMVLVPPPRRTGEGEEHREISWERIAAE
jgi:Lipocalin-like domain